MQPSVGRGFGAVTPKVIPIPRLMRVRGRGFAGLLGPRGFSPTPVQLHQIWILSRAKAGTGLSGLGQTGTVAVNVGPGTEIQMSPADAAAYWATGSVTTESGGTALQNSAGNYTAPAPPQSAANAFGSYLPTVTAAYQASPTIAYELQGSGVQNPSAPPVMAGGPKYVSLSNVGGTTGPTTVMDLQSYIANYLQLMTGSGPQSSAALGGPAGADTNLLQLAQGYCALYPTPDCGLASQEQIVGAASTAFNNWWSDSLNRQVSIGPAGPLPVVSYGGAAPGVQVLSESNAGAIAPSGPVGSLLGGSGPGVTLGSGGPVGAARVPGLAPVSLVSGGAAGGTAPGSSAAAAGGASAGPAATAAPSITDLLTGTAVAGIPNWILLAGGAALVFLMAKK